LLYLFMWSAILGATLFKEDDEETEDWLKLGRRGSSDPQRNRITKILGCGSDLS